MGRRCASQVEVENEVEDEVEDECGCAAQDENEVEDVVEGEWSHQTPNSNCKLKL
jgi:hypothetical protein